MPDLSTLTDEDLTALEASDAGQKTPPEVLAEQARRAAVVEPVEPVEPETPAEAPEAV